MKKILLLVFALAASVGILRAQDAPYYGTPFYKEGFDSNTIAKTNWIQAGDSAGIANNTLWKPGNPNAAQLFSLAEPQSLFSAAVKFTNGVAIKTMLTSPEIDMAGKQNICLGFSLNYEKANVSVACVATKDNGATWDTLWFSYKPSIYEVQSTAALPPASVAWTTYKVFLPSHYNGQKIKMRFITNSSTTATTLYLDGVFLSERRAVDAQLLSITIKNKEMLRGIPSNTTPFTDGFLNESITVKYRNNGTSPINTIKLAYQLNTNSPVEETTTLSSPLPVGDSALYTFNTFADLSNVGITKVKVFLDITGEQNRYDDSTKATIQISNVTKPLPYNADWLKNSVDNWDKTGSPAWTTGDIGKNYDCTFTNTSASAANSFLFSAPFSLKTGESYDFRFSLFTNSTIATDVNAVDIYIATTKDVSVLSTLTPVFSKTDISNDNKYRDYFLRFTPSKDSIYYITFCAKSAAQSKQLALENFWLTLSGIKNAQTLSLLAPVTPKYEYGNVEQVKIRIRNSGTSAIAANTLTAYYQLDNNAPFQQTVAAGINPASTLDFAFTKTIDIATLGNKNLKTWVVLGGDIALYNDTINTTIEPVVTKLPYSFSFMKDGTRTYEEDFWTIKDLNNDTRMWVAATSSNPASNYFEYGGVPSGSGAFTIPSSNDLLLSRPLRLSTNEKLAISYTARLGTNNNTLPLTVKLYRKVGENFIAVDSLGIDTVKRTTATGAAFLPFSKEARITSTGDYYVGFLVNTNQAINFKIQLQTINIESTFDHDLTISETLFPGDSIAALDSLPLGIRITNRGVNTENSFSVNYQVNGGAIFTEAIAQTIPSKGEWLHYFATQPHFTGTGLETLKTWVTLATDEAGYNDTSITSVTNIAIGAVPYNVSTTGSFAQFLKIDNNQDGNRWMTATSGGSGGLGGSIGYIYTANGYQADDYLFTRQIQLEAGKTYQLKFNASVDSVQNIADLQILMSKSNHVNDLKEIAFLKGINVTANNTPHIVYFTPEADTNYTIAFRATGNTKVLKITRVDIIEVTDKPDVGISIIYPRTNGEYTATDSVVIRLGNHGTVPLAGIPVTCKVNGITLNAVVYGNSGIIDTSSSVQYTFKNVDLYEIGTYNITASISVNEDVYVLDDTARRTIQSIPVLDVALTALVNPLSGTPEGAADVTVKVKNTGKGDVSNIPISYSLDGGTLVYDTIRTVIAQDQEIDYTFGTKADVSVEKLYSLLVYLSMDRDANTMNDTIRKDIRKSLSGFDLSVTDIVAPFTGRLTKAEKVTIKVRNNSTFSMPDVSVYCRLNDTTILSGNISSIAAEAEIEYTFAGTFNMAAYGNYTLIAFTNYIVEADRSNDTLNKIVHCNKLDVGVVGLKSPVSKYNMGLEPITIVVKNIGEESADTIPVRYSYDGRNPINGRVLAAIAPGDSVEFTFSEPEDLSVEGTYNFYLYTDLTGDDERGNDALSVSVTNMGVGIDDVSKEPVTIKVYPNPATSLLNIYSNEPIKHLTVYNANGQIIENVSKVGQTNYVLHLDSYRKGVYIVEIKTDKGVATRKFIVQ